MSDKLVSPRYIRILSDLHLEQFYGDHPVFLINKFIPADARDAESVLVLAGDISSKPNQLVQFLREVEKRFLHVIYVPGNHEFYGHNYHKWATDFDKSMNLPEGEESKTAFSTLGVGYKELENIRFIFTTMWADGGGSLEAQSKVGQGLRDFFVIRQGNDFTRFTVQDMMALHTKQRVKVEELLKTPFDGPTVVVTHHMPSYKLCHPRFGNQINGGFAANLEYLLEGDYAPELWIHGHTHDRISTDKWKTLIECNPAGYHFETGGAPYNTFNDGPVFVCIVDLELAKNGG